jgi:hypothetical protein
LIEVKNEGALKQNTVISTREQKKEKESMSYETPSRDLAYT